MKNRLIFILIVALILASVSSVLSQEDDDSAAREIILEAVAGLADGYEFATAQSVALRYVYADDQLTETYTEFYFDGLVSASGDYRIRFTMNAGPNADSISKLPPVVADVISYEGVRFVNLQTLGTVFGASYRGVAAGWQNRAALLESLDDPNQRANVANLTSFVWLVDLPFDDLILSVVEQEPDTVDDVRVRVFDAELDGLEMFMTLMQFTPQQRERFLTGQAELIAESEFNLHYSFWIGAEDGYLYRADSRFRQFVPTLSEGAPGLPYDQDIVTLTGFRAWAHGEVDEIDLPEEIELPG